MKPNILLLAAAVFAASPAAAAAAVPKSAAPAATEDQLAEAAKAVGEFDFERLMNDDGYARALLLHAERLAPGTEAVPELRDMVAIVRTLALGKLGRAKEAYEVSAAALAGGDAGPSVYATALMAAGEMADKAAMLHVYEAAAKLPEAPRREFRSMMVDDLVSGLWQILQSDKDEAGRHRFAEALLALEWPDEGDISSRDFYRSIAIDRRIAAGEIAGARALAAEIVKPTALAELLLATKYDVLFPAGVDRTAMLQQSLPRYDRVTRERLEAAPSDSKRLMHRGNALRALGRDEEALAVLLPFASDMKKVEAAGEDGFWVTNEAAFTLSALGRHDEAVALYDKLLALGIDKYPELVSMAINRGEALTAAGRFKEAVTDSAAQDAGKLYASPYGYMWIWSNAACGHAMAGDAAGAAPWLAKLEKGSEDNRAAHLRALLCANDMDGAEKVLIARLKSDDGPQMLLKLQDYRGGDSGTGGAVAKVIEPRFLALRDRPAVREAIAGTGRILSLPLSRTYWGDY